jgi:hypothetical protein
LVTIDGSVGTQVATAVFRLSGTHNWTSNNVYLLKGIILVGSGAVVNVEPGTVIRGANEVTTKAAYNADFRPGMLVVERGGKLYANGTPEHPIIMTDEWDNHNPWAGQTGSSVTRTWWYRNGSGTLVTKTSEAYNYGAIGNLHGAWGGLVLCGKAFVNWDTVTAPADLGTATIGVEGLDTGLGVVGGGNDDDDSSGVVKYLQIRYGGYQLASTKEINGLTFYGVGRGTEIHHVEVLNNQDDCFEWFGGCVNAKYLVAWGNGDDIFDSDAGFRGKNQFLFGVQRDLGGSKIESGAADKGLEMDGYETVAGSGSLLFSASLWNNVTLIGNQYVDASKRNVAISMRDNAAPQIYNGVFMDFGSRATFIENRTDLTANGINLNCAERFATNRTNMPSWTAQNAAGQTVGPAYLYKAQVSNTYFNAELAAKQACLRGSVFWNIPAGLYPTEVGGTALKAAYSWVDSVAGKGPWCTTGLTLYSTWSAASEGNITDIYNNTGGDSANADDSNLMPIKRRYRTQVARTATTSYELTQVDPRAANDATTGAAYVPDSWMTPTAYRGAFGPEKNWAQGWTTIASLGMFGTYTAAPALDEATGSTTYVTNNVTTYVTNNVTTYVTNTVTTVVTNGVNGIVYQGSGTLLTSGTGVAAAGLQTSPVLTYSITSAGTYQLQTTASLSPVSWTVVRTFTVASASAGSPVTVNLTDIIGETPPHAGDQRFYQLLKQ